MHLSYSLVTTSRLGLAGLSARWAALWLVGITLGGKELLFTGREDEFHSTLYTAKSLVRKRHWMTSFPKYVAQLWSSSAKG